MELQVGSLGLTGDHYCKGEVGEASFDWFRAQDFVGVEITHVFWDLGFCFVSLAGEGTQGLNMLGKAVYP